MCDASPSRRGMGDALGIEDDEIGERLELLQRGEHGRPLSEGQQARHVGKRARQPDAGLLDGRQIGKVKDDHRGACHPIAEADIHPGYRADAGRVPGSFRDHATCQNILYLARFFGGYVPRM